MNKPDDHGDRSAPLQQQADLVCSALDAAPHGFAILTIEGRVVAANGTLKRWAGDDLSPSGRAPQPTAAGPALRGFCLSQRSELRGAVRRAAAGEAVCFETGRLELVPDVRGAFGVQVSPWMLEGRCIAVCLLVHDVTDEPGARDRASELSFRQLFDSVPDALLVVRRSVVLYANRSSSILLGYDWQDELAGRPVFDVVRSKDPKLGLLEVAAGDTVQVDLVCRDGRAIASTMVQARLLIDDSPTIVMALRPLSGQTSKVGAEGVDREWERLESALRDADTALEQARTALGNGSASSHLEEVGLAVRRAIEMAESAGAVRRGSSSKASPPRGSAAETTAGVAAPGSRSPATPTVLVCDDESRLATLTAGLLDQYGYNAVTVATGAEALEQLDTGSSDVLLLDMNLPDGSADQVIAQMKQRGLQTPVILTSGYAEEDVDPKLLADQLVSSYLAKPYSVDRLVQAIRDATRGQEPAPGSQ